MVANIQLSPVSQADHLFGGPSDDRGEHPLHEVVQFSVMQCSDRSYLNRQIQFTCVELNLRSTAFYSMLKNTWGF